MADLGIVKAGKGVASAGQAASTGAAGAEKTAPSKFDQVRAQIADKVAADVKLPALAQVTPQQRAGLEVSLQQNLTQSGASSPRELFGPQMKSTQLSIQTLAGTIDKLPQNSSLAPISARLKAIEAQYQQAGRALDNLSSMDSKSLLDLQVQFYQVSQNVELLSKVVDGVTSGTKTILQTQVG